MKAGNRLSGLDWSTVNLDELAKLQQVTLPPTYRLQDDCGNGCAGDPPGFPTYFTRSVYTRCGNSPSRGATLVIGYHGVLYEVQRADNWDPPDALMLRLWKPLPLEHPRTQAWIRDAFIHYHDCYKVPATGDTLVWPGGTLGRTPFGELHDVAFEIEHARKYRDYDRWTDGHKAALEASLREDNEYVTQRCTALAVPENHKATVEVRRYYPAFVPTPELMAAEYERAGDWWETMSECPTPEACPGQHGQAHPANGTWCQFCGWSKK